MSLRLASTTAAHLDTDAVESSMSVQQTASRYRSTSRVFVEVCAKRLPGLGMSVFGVVRSVHNSGKRARRDTYKYNNGTDMKYRQHATQTKQSWK